MMTSSSARIHLLDPITVNQIAAGEVVERPAAALKELVENALDAGASVISVQLKGAGRQLIRVTDNGCGLSEEDAQMALQRHATSKITSLEDLEVASTLGFRGEAVPSIASVSRMRLSTSVSDGLRTVIVVEGGQTVSVSKDSGPRGTDIVVEDLFYNTPARLKFLKSDTTEVGQALDHLSRYAMIYPQVSFSLTHNGQVALRTTGSGDILQAIGEVWGREVAKALTPVDMVIGGLRVVGYVSPPHLTKPNRTYQYLFVNRRPVRARMLTVALDQAFRDLTPDRRFPLVCLNIEIDPERVDVNVSPTKSEVKFQHEGSAFEALRIAIRQALLDHGMMPSAAQIAIANDALAGLQPGAGANGSGGGYGGILGSGFIRDPRPGDGPAYSFVRESMPHPGGGSQPFAPTTAGQSASTQQLIDAQSPIDSSVVGGNLEPFSYERTQPDGPLIEPQLAGQHLSEIPRNEGMQYLHLLDDLRIIGQALKTFIVAETRHGIVLVDQHVAHERILYEYLCGMKRSMAIEKQRLLVPQTLHLDRRAALILHEKLDEIAAVGFELDPFGGESFIVRAVPAAIGNKDPLKMLRDLVDELIESAVTKKLVPTREAIWIMSACKMAVKSGDPLSNAEMEKLMVDLATTENPYHCPHGRPITVTLKGDDLLRLFKRIH